MKQTFLALDPKPVLLEQTFAWRKAMQYWDAKGMYAFTEAGGEVNNGISNSSCHIDSLKAILAAFGFCNDSWQQPVRIVEYGAGTPFFAENFLWHEENASLKFAGGVENWEWVLTDLQEEKIRSMEPYITNPTRIKLAVTDAQKPEHLQFLSKESEKPYKPYIAIANYLLGVLPWIQVKKDPKTKNILIADYQTVAELSTNREQKYGQRQIYRIIEAFASDDLNLLRRLNWKLYQKHILLKPVFRKATIKEITPLIELALELSEGEETIVNHQAINFLEKVVLSLPPNGIIFGNEYTANRAGYAYQVKKAGFIFPTFLGGSLVIGVNNELLNSYFNQKHYSFLLDSYGWYGLYCLLPTANCNIDLVRELLQKENHFMRESELVLRKFQSDNSIIDRLESIRLLEQIKYRYGIDFTLSFELASLYSSVGNIDQALKNIRAALNLCPINPEARALCRELNRMKVDEFSGL